MNYIKYKKSTNLKKIKTSNLKNKILIDVGYGQGQLTPNGSRSSAEQRQLAILVMKVHGISGQFI